MGPAVTAAREQEEEEELQELEGAAGEEADARDSMLQEPIFALEEDQSPLESKPPTASWVNPFIGASDNVHVAMQILIGAVHPAIAKEPLISVFKLFKSNDIGPTFLDSAEPSASTLSNFVL